VNKKQPDLAENRRGIGLLNEISRKNQDSLGQSTKHLIPLTAKSWSMMAMEISMINVVLLGYLAALVPSVIALTWFAWRVPGHRT
jgi:hypothetical protein